eukprot:CFRG3265T1
MPMEMSTSMQPQSTDSAIGDLLKRVDRAERVVFGAEGMTNNTVCISDCLSNLTAVLQTVDPTKDMQTIVCQCKRIDKAVKNGDLMADNVKLHIILTCVNDIERRAKLIKELQSAVKILSKKSVVSDAANVNHMYAMSQDQPHWKSVVGKLTDRTEVLLREYNEMINMLSLEFCKWDEFVRAVEKQRQAQHAKNMW